MQGTSSLTAYAGQVVTLSGIGSLISLGQAVTLLGEGSLTAYDFDVLLRGQGYLVTSDAQFASATMSGTSYSYINATYYYGRAQLPALNSIGRDATNTTVHGVGDLQPLTSTGEAAGSYDPEAISIGYGNLPILASDGIVIQSDYGEGDPDLPALTSKGGDYVYGESLSYLQPLMGFASYSNLASGFIRLKNVIISGELLNEESYYATGDISLPKLKVEGYTGHIGEVVLPSMQVNSIAYADYFSTGDIELKPLVVNSVAEFVALSSGNIDLKSLEVDGTGIFIPQADGSILFKVLTISGEASFSPLGDRAGNIVLPKLEVNGIINNVEAPYVLQYERNPTC